MTNWTFLNNLASIFNEAYDLLKFSKGLLGIPYRVNER